MSFRFCAGCFASSTAGCFASSTAGGFGASSGLRRDGTPWFTLGLANRFFFRPTKLSIICISAKECLKIQNALVKACELPVNPGGEIRLKSENSPFGERLRNSGIVPHSNQPVHHRVKDGKDALRELVGESRQEANEKLPRILLVRQALLLVRIETKHNLPQGNPEFLLVLQPAFIQDAVVQTISGTSLLCGKRTVGEWIVGSLARGSTPPILGRTRSIGE